MSTGGFEENKAWWWLISSRN